MITRTYTAASFGLEVYPVEVEIDGKQGIPQFILIGLASRAVEEAKERITSALHNCGIRIQSKRTIVNLAPASVPKSGTAFDLAIVIGLLKLYGEIRFETDGVLFLGELALDGKIKPIPAALPLILGAKKLGFHTIVLPRQNQNEVSTISGIKLFAIDHLSEILESTGLEQLSQIRPHTFQAQNTQMGTIFTSIIGQEKAKRAVVLAAAGGHNVLLNGPPGSGKTQLANEMTELLPPLSEPESIEVTAIHSLARLPFSGLLTQRPFRSPHHSISRTGLLGGGNPLKPGEISLAHHGVLFLDELLEFPESLLDMLRQPLEERRMTISLNSGHTSFPASITLLAATNPCPCGYLGSFTTACTCSPGSIERYRRKLSGPLFDRFDIRLEMQQERKLFGEQKERSSFSEMKELREKIAHCREKQQHRYKKYALSTVAELTFTQLQESSVFHPSARQQLNREAMQHNLSGRGYWSVVKLAQTFADLEGSLVIHPQHISDAVELRVPPSAR